MTGPRLASLAAIAAIAIALASAGAAAEEADWRAQFPRLRYGVQSVETQGAALTRYRKFGDYVERKLGIELEVHLASEYAGIIQAIAAGQIDLMDMGASGYAAAWLETNGRVEPLVVPQEKDGAIGYYSVMFVRADSEFRSLEDLVGRTFAWADPNSASGYLFPLVSLRAQGIDPETYFRSVVFSGGHEQSIIGVLDGAYDAAVTWTNDVVQHTRGGLHMMLERGILEADDIRIVWTSDLIPNPVIAVRSELPQRMKDELRAFFIAMNEEDPEVFADVARGESAGYVAVEHGAYRVAIELRQQLAAERRTRRR
jgi:phosphonate transport system substrate-binding protein